MLIESLFSWLADHWQDVIAVPVLGFMLINQQRNSTSIAVMKSELANIGKAVNHTREGEKTLRELVQENNTKIARLEGRAEQQQ